MKLLLISILLFVSIETKAPEFPLLEQDEEKLVIHLSVAKLEDGTEGIGMPFEDFQILSKKLEQLLLNKYDLEDKLKKTKEDLEVCKDICKRRT